MQVRRVCVSEESYERELKLEMSSEVYDCIVVGAGIQGSCTAYQLAKNKQRTLLLEQVGAVCCISKSFAQSYDLSLNSKRQHKNVSQFIKAEYSERKKCTRQHYFLHIWI